MTAPNLISANTINGKTIGTTLTNTSAFAVLNNAVGSGKCLKINTVNVSNFSASNVVISVSYYSGASLGGTAFPIAGNITLPAGSTLNVIDKSTQYYLEENTCLGATASVANAIAVTASYEDIS
jgi:hypothetical protein